MCDGSLQLMQKCICIYRFHMVFLFLIVTHYVIPTPFTLPMNMHITNVLSFISLTRDFPMSKAYSQIFIWRVLSKISKFDCIFRSSKKQKIPKRN